MSDLSQNNNSFVLSIILVLSIFLALSQGYTKKDAKEILASFADNCKPPPTEDDFEAILTNNRSPLKSAKCFRNCLLKEFSIIQNSKINVEAAKQYYGMAYKGEDEVGGQIADICNKKVTDKDECEAAHSYMLCVLDELKSRNKKIENLE